MNRWLQFILLLFLLIFLSWYGAKNNPWTTLKDAQANPDVYDGRLINLFIFPRITALYADGFQIKQVDGLSIRVFGDTTGLRTGEFVGLQAIYHHEGFLTATRATVAKNRKYKIVLSLIPVVFVLLLFGKFYRFNVRKFQFELSNA